MHRLRLASLPDLERFCAFLRDVQVRVHDAQADGVLASIPGAMSPLHERRELLGYVATWNALNPAAHVELDDAS